MSERDYRTYMELFQNMANFMRKPNLIVHLDVSPEESLRRIKLRCLKQKQLICTEIRKCYWITDQHCMLVRARWKVYIDMSDD